MKELLIDLEKEFSEGISEREKEVKSLKDIDYLSSEENSQVSNEDFQEPKACSTLFFYLIIL